MNKEKMVEYQRKMATLNNEINLTQNLYQAFMKSKARSQLGDSPWSNIVISHYLNIFKFNIYT